MIAPRRLELEPGIGHGFLGGEMLGLSLACASLRRPASACVSLRQPVPTCVSLCQPVSVSLRRPASA
eukprot:10835356-Lingulodinium_polyedra.AAC.1